MEITGIIVLGILALGVYLAWQFFSSGPVRAVESSMDCFKRCPACMIAGQTGDPQNTAACNQCMLMTCS